VFGPAGMLALPPVADAPASMPCLAIGLAASRCSGVFAPVLGPDGMAALSPEAVAGGVGVWACAWAPKISAAVMAAAAGNLHIVRFENFIFIPSVGLVLKRLVKQTTPAVLKKG
jgi:hypothetical protein